MRAEVIRKVKEGSLKTPCYLYDLEVLRRNLAVVNQEKPSNAKVYYAVKANYNLPILKEMVSAGLGADCVSGYEIKQAVEAGFNPKSIVFAGVGKTDEEILYAIQIGIGCFNVESFEELEVINELATSEQKVVDVAIRINPNVNAKTHAHITTGIEENKFGVSYKQFKNNLDLIKSYPNIDLVGLHFHIGSQILDLDVYEELCTVVNDIVNELNEKGINLKLVNLGGGLGVDYEKEFSSNAERFEAYFQIFKERIHFSDESIQLQFELGRSLVANMGWLLSKVTYVKKGDSKDFVVLDAGMTELIRPALYQAYHPIENITCGDDEEKVYDVVGPICESSDCFGKSVQLPVTKRGDLVLIHQVGAYGEAMSSRYNLRPQAMSLFLNQKAAADI